MHLESAPSLIDYCALATLLAVTDAYYSRQLLPRVGRRGTVILVLPPVVLTTLLLAIDPKHRYIFWWFPIGVAGPTILAATLHPPILLVRWRSRLAALWPKPGKQRALASLWVGLVIASALASVLGTVLLVNATQDLRLAFAVSLLAALLLRLAWELVARRLRGAADQPDGSLSG